MYCEGYIKIKVTSNCYSQLASMVDDIKYKMINEQEFGIVETTEEYSEDWNHIAFIEFIEIVL